MAPLAHVLALLAGILKQDLTTNTPPFRQTPTSDIYDTCAYTVLP